MKKKMDINAVEQKFASFFKEQRRMPTYSEMLPLLGVKAKSAAEYWIKKLLEKGSLEKDTKGFLKPSRLSFHLPVVGNVAAGFPSPAEEELRDTMSFDEYLVNNPASSFILSVTGDSMIGEGIKDKDLVIVERGREPKNGDIILAEVDGRWTMKYFHKRGKKITLEAANPKYPPITPQEELRIAGVITAVVRKYHK
ncbi:sos-response repressor and protease lexa [hydrocarbon metagenome]|uniref:Sos-response repressor and protease lexa n=1 Tax=hydrocarbon metagenome TaxID=938273 RepID=A0A0W8FMH4_9ZZZZ